MRRTLKAAFLMLAVGGFLTFATPVAQAGNHGPHCRLNCGHFHRGNGFNNGFGGWNGGFNSFGGWNGRFNKGFGFGNNFNGNKFGGWNNGFNNFGGNGRHCGR